MKLILIIALFVFISSNGYHRSLLQPVTLNKLEEDDKILSWNWADFKIGENETIYLVKVELFSFSSKLGLWRGAVGTTVKDAPDDYWYISEEMSEMFSSNEGVITWIVPENIAKKIPNGKGQLRFGIWEIGLDSFYIKSLYVETIHNK